MALESKGAFIWHAYNALDEQQNGEVNKTRLKVLSHNICMSVGIPSVIKNIGHFLDSLDDHTHNNHLSFLEYYFFIKTELFDKIRNSGEINANADLTKCDEVCWLVCLRKYLQRDLKIIDNKDAFKLFQLFNFLAEVEPSGAVACPVVMDSEEVELIVQKFCKIVGVEFEVEEFHRIAKEISSFNYQQLLVLLETQYCKTADPNLISSAIAEIHDETLVEVIKKGHLTKKGHRVGSWKDRWFVLTPYGLCYYTGRDEKEKKGDVPVTSNSAVECLPDKAEKFPSKHPHKFIFHSEARNLEMGAPDVRTRSEWVTALKNAIQYCNKPQSLQQMALTKRRQLREQRRKREEEEEEAKKQKEAAIEKTKLEMEALQQAKEEAEKRIQEGDKLREENLAKSKEEKDQLERDMQTKLEQLGMAHAQAEEKRTEEELKRQEEERRKREEMERELMDSRKETVEVEAKLAKEEELREAYEKRIKELETLQAELERHLEEETQAKRDEEIVRNAQARVLNEEIEKREQLELLQKQLDNLLKEEVQKRVDLEGEKARQEESLKQTQDSLECEREKLREAHEKIEKVREEKASVTEKMNVKKEEKISFMARLNRLLKPEDKDPNPTTHRGVGSITATECIVKERKFSTERLLSVPREDGQSPHSDSWLSHDDTETPILDTMYDNLPRATDQNDNPIAEGDEAAEEDAFNTENNEEDVKVDQTDNKTDDKMDDQMDDQTADKMDDKMDESVTALSS